MKLQTLNDVNVAGKRVLVRADFNVPMKDGVITDNTRVKLTLPTINYLLDNGAKMVVLMSHFGRPKGKRNEKYSLAPVAQCLTNELQKKVYFLTDCVGNGAAEKISEIKEDGAVVLLENVRFYSEEESNEQAFALRLSDYGDIFVNDAFGSSHRAHASVVGVTSFLPSYAGFLVEKEVVNLNRLIEGKKDNFVAVIGGAKVSSKIGVLESLLEMANSIIIGGAMAYTFLKVQGVKVGKSLVDVESIDVAKNFLLKAKAAGVEILLPVDHVCAFEMSEEAESKVVIDIPDDQMGLDIGPKSVNFFSLKLSSAKNIFWNGPMGAFEIDQFGKGTEGIGEAIASNKDAFSVAGGGDTVSAVNKYKLAKKLSFISSGGGASMEFLGGPLPGITVLER